MAGIACYLTQYAMKLIGFIRNGVNEFQIDWFLVDWVDRALGYRVNELSDYQIGSQLIGSSDVRLSELRFG